MVKKQTLHKERPGLLCVRLIDEQVTDTQQLTDFPGRGSAPIPLATPTSPPLPPPASFLPFPVLSSSPLKPGSDCKRRLGRGQPSGRDKGDLSTQLRTLLTAAGAAALCPSCPAWGDPRGAPAEPPGQDWRGISSHTSSSPASFLPSVAVAFDCGPLGAKFESHLNNVRKGAKGDRTVEERPETPSPTYPSSRAPVPWVYGGRWGERCRVLGCTGKVGGARLSPAAFRWFAGCSLYPSGLSLAPAPRNCRSQAKVIFHTRSFLLPGIAKCD